MKSKGNRQHPKCKPRLKSEPELVPCRISRFRFLPTCRKNSLEQEFSKNGGIFQIGETGCAYCLSAEWEIHPGMFRLTTVLLRRNLCRSISRHEVLCKTSASFFPSWWKKPDFKKPCHWQSLNSILALIKIRFCS